MSDPVETICSLVGCSRDDAEISYARTNSILESVDELMVIPQSAVKLPVKRKRELTPEEEEVTRIRHLMEKAEIEIQKNVTASNQRETQDCRMPSLISEVEIPEVEHVFPSRENDL